MAGWNAKLAGALLALSLAAGGTAAAQNGMPASGFIAPIFDDEIFAVTANGCGVITQVYDGFTPAIQETWRADMAARTWTGDCTNNLVNGEGELGPGWRRTYVQGRWIGSGQNANGPMVVSRPPVTAMVSADYLTPHFNDDHFFIVMGADSAKGMILPCPANARPRVRCQRNDRVYAVVVRENGVDRTAYCPEPTTPVGCETVWRDHIAPFIARIEAFRAEVAAEVHDRAARAAPLIEAWNNAGPTRIAQ